MANQERILFETDTKHDHYTVVEREYEGRPARVLFSGTRRSAQSGIGLDDDPDLLFDYNQRLLELANGIYPKNILVIGGGVFTLPMALQAALPDAKITVVELDEDLKSIAERYFGLRESERLKLHFGDGRGFIEQDTGGYDLIIIDVFTDLAIPKQFLSIEFVQLAADTLNTGGIVALNIIASYQGRNAGLIKSQLAAYQSTFAQVDIFPAGFGLTSWLPQNLVLIAQKSPIQQVKHYLRYAAIPSITATTADLYHDESPVKAA